MTPELLELLVKLFGPVGIAMSGGGWLLHRYVIQLSEVQEKRIADSQLAMQRMVDLVNKQHEQMALVTSAIEGNASTIAEVRRAVEAYAESNRELRVWLADTMKAAPQEPPKRFTVDERVERPERVDRVERPRGGNWR